MNEHEYYEHRHIIYSYLFTYTWTRPGNNSVHFLNLCLDECEQPQQDGDENMVTSDS